MIENSEISIIVQGAIGKYTKDSLKSLRNNFPDSQIILSTWEGSDVSDLDFDLVVYSKDPGAVIIDEITKTFNNVNRQIITTKAALIYADRKYILKTRTDIVWLGNNILKYFGVYDIHKKSKHLKNRILICNYYTRNPCIMPIAFHLSDWIAFGNKEDIKILYDIELEEFSEMQWFRSNKRKYNGFYTNLLTRYVPEQYISMNFAKKYYEFNFNCFYDASVDNIKITEEILAYDFVVLDYKKQLNISFPKYNPNRYYEKYTLVSNMYWEKLYNEYCLQKGNKYIRKIQNYVLKVIFYVRQFLLVILHKLHIKEKVKKILTQI